MNQLVLERIYYPVTELGYGKRLGIWVRGCSKRCPGCISPELQDYHGRSVSVSDIISSLPEDFFADGLTISGGEPFDQTEGLLEFVRWFTGHISDDVLIFTGYTLGELENRADACTKELLEKTAVLIDGPYIESLNDGKGLRGSSNQRINIFKYKERYEDADQWTRMVQFVVGDDSLLQIGIPPLA